jgi:hypothetical protein
MAEISAGAGEGNRTPVVSLGSLSCRGFLPVFRKSSAAQWQNIAGFKVEHRPSLPHLYRADEIGPRTSCKRDGSLASKRIGGVRD